MIHLPQLPYILKVALILSSGIALLRLAGKKSIAQQTIPEAIFMIAVGTVLIQPIGQKSEWRAVYGGALLILGMLFVSYLQIWVPSLQKYILGVPKTLVQDGEILIRNLKRERMTHDMFIMRLRQRGIEDVKELKKVVLEPSGELSITREERKKPATKEDIHDILHRLDRLIELLERKT